MPKSDNFSSNQKESQKQEKKDRFTVLSQAAVPSLYLANVENLVSPIEELKQTFESRNQSKITKESNCIKLIAVFLNHEAAPR